MTGRDVQNMYNDVRDHGRIMKGPNDKRDKSLSASYTKSLYRMFHICLQRAVKERLIEVRGIRCNRQIRTIGSQQPITSI